ncbi:hypothetical protein C900_05434 [Fulvivirga imtechensis AK7]|uniref:SnoaL-like domain-containing protein n=2 Tax=Fulvivirga TaxID=396811 RepID=L8JNR1_9BACT|nr:hypothetical protein C900_05434 [Fulvivirga imtechensis AK7]
MESAYKEFKLFLKWVPHFKGEVISSSSEGNLLFIEWFMYFRFKNGHPLRVRAVDKIIVENGLIKERSVYFNTLPVILYILKRPWLWYGYLRYRRALRK